MRLRLMKLHLPKRHLEGESVLTPTPWGRRIAKALFEEELLQNQ